MSTETSEWLNRNVLVGFTDQRGQAWHYRESNQGDEPNHYPGAIPLDDVRRRLFAWNAQAVPMFVAGPGADGGDTVEVPNRKAIIRDDTHEVLGVVSDSYVPHQYEDVLLKQVSAILDDDLQIGSAGLLKGGAIAWVQVEMAKNWTVADVEFRPHLLATTSFNGSIPTTYKKTVTIVVCDNTRATALKEPGDSYRVRHTANSAVKLGEARTVLKIIHDLGQDFAAEVEKLLSVKVTDSMFTKFVEHLVPLRNDASKTAITKAETDRGNYMKLWNDDARVTPWKGTAFGALQAVNTYRQHVRPTRGDTIRVERNMMDTLTGQTESGDTVALQRLLRLSK